MKAFVKRNAVWIMFITSSIVMLVIAIAVSAMMLSSAATIEATSKQHILALSRAAALLVTAEELDQFNLPEEGRLPQYDALRHRLATFNEISGTDYTYFLRLNRETNMMQFIIDNTLLDEVALDLPPVPREPAPDLALTGVANTVELGSYSDGWAGYLTAFAPVYYADGRISNIVAGVDMVDVYIRRAQTEMNQLSILLVITISAVLASCLYSLFLYQQKAKQAQMASEAKSSFLSNTSHEIRTPMNAILGMADLIMHEEASDTVRGYATDIRNASRGLLTIINDILDISKIESGKLEITPARYHISSLIADTISIVRMRTEEKNLLFAAHIDPNIPSELIGDETRIKQVLINLLNNAVKFTREGEITLTLRYRIQGELCQLLITVEDTGIGIKSEDLSNIFNLFQQVDTKINRNIEGTGLGLSISQQLVEMMDGFIDVQSQYGVGSIFRVSIMQHIASREPMTQLVNPERNAVLIYENRPLYLNSLTYALDSLGCNYVICSNRSDMYEHLDSARYGYLFISSLYINNVQAVASQKQPDAVLVVLSGDGNVHSDAISISMPIHCLQIANILNDKYSGMVSDLAISELAAPEAKVLVVDDNAVNLKVAIGLLNLFEITADTALSGHLALEMVQQTDYDLVFMDHMMPEMDGIDTTVAIRALGEKYRDLPIVALTANAIGGVKEMFIAEGLDDFIAKPIEIKKLSSVLQSWLPQSKQHAKTVESPTSPAEPLAPAKIRGVDFEIGLKHAGGHLGAYHEILAVYQDDCRGKISDIALEHQRGNLRALTIMVHAVKSASANIGAMALTVLAESLEAAGKAGDTGHLDAHLPKLLDDLSVLLADVGKYLDTLPKEAVTRDKPADMGYLRDTLTRMERYLDELDLDAMESALIDVSAYRWSEDILTCVHKAKACMGQFDYDGLAAAIAQLRAAVE